MTKFLTITGDPNAAMLHPVKSDYFPSQQCSQCRQNLLSVPRLDHGTKPYVRQQVCQPRGPQRCVRLAVCERSQRCAVGVRFKHEELQQEVPAGALLTPPSFPCNAFHLVPFIWFLSSGSIRFGHMIYLTFTYSIAHVHKYQSDREDVHRLSTPRKGKVGGLRRYRVVQ